MYQFKCDREYELVERVYKEYDPLFSNYGVRTYLAYMSNDKKVRFKLQDNYQSINRTDHIAIMDKIKQEGYTKSVDHFWYYFFDYACR